MIEDFIVFDTLKSYATLTVIVMLSTEFTKRIWEKCPLKTEVVVFIYSFILVNLGLITNFSYGETIIEILSNIILSIFNALVIGYSASASYSKIISNYDIKKEKEASSSSESSKVTVPED